MENAERLGKSAAEQMLKHRARPTGLIPTIRKLRKAFKRRGAGDREKEVNKK